MLNQNRLYKIDENLSKHPQSKNIISCLDRLCSTSTVERLPGNCISACDILQNMLSFFDVQSSIIECQVMAIKENNQQKEFCFIGFNNVESLEGTIDSHVVIVTQTTPPIIIDASIGNLLPKNEQILVKVLDNLDPNIIAEFKIEDVLLTYHHKKVIRLPSLHQKNLIQRFKEEQDLKEKYGFLTKLLYVIAGITVYNFIANNLMIILKIIFP